MRAMSRVIFAADYPTVAQAVEQCSHLSEYGIKVKLGKEVLTSALFSSPVDGELRKEFERLDLPLMIDLKYNDIPDTMVGAAAALVRGCNNLFGFTVHCLSGPAALKRVVEKVREISSFREGIKEPLVIGVTVLTSLDKDDLFRMGIDRTPASEVDLLVRMAYEANVPAIVCSAQEATLVKRIYPQCAVITPGIRLIGADPGKSQKRVVDPRSAIAAGADYLVIGSDLKANPGVLPQRVAAIENEIIEGLADRLSSSLTKVNKIKFGEFKLKLHEKHPAAPLSPYYLNLRDLTEDQLSGIALGMAWRGADWFERWPYIVSIPHAANPIAERLAKLLNLRWGTLIKEEAPDKKRKIIGPLIGQPPLDPLNRECVLIDDVITGAHTKLEAIEACEAEGYKVLGVLVMYDREQGGAEVLEAKGYKVLSVQKVSSTMDGLFASSLIDGDQRKVVHSYLQHMRENYSEE